MLSSAVELDGNVLVCEIYMCVYVCVYTGGRAKDDDGDDGGVYLRVICPGTLVLM